MRRLARFLPGLIVALAALPAVAALAAEVTAVAPEPFFRHADYGDLQLSPSGKYLAGLIPAAGRLRLGVIDLDARSSRIVASMEGQDIGSFSWVNDDRLVFSVIDLQAALGVQRGGGLFAVNRDSTDFRTLAPTVKRIMGSGQMVFRFTALHSTLRDGSDDVLVLNNERNARFPDVYRMDTKTARKTILTADNPGSIVTWIADRQGAVRAAVSDEESKSSRFYWRASAESAWVQLGEYKLRGESMSPVAFDGDGTLLVSSNLGRDKAAIHKYDTAAKRLGAEFVAHPQVDLTGGFRFDPTKNRIVGILYSGDRPGVAWFDDEYARLQDAIDKALPDRMNAISWGTGSSRVLIASYSDTDPGSYYLLDREKRKLEFLAAQRKAIKPETMPARKPIRYAARDGLEIPAYLTLPKGKESARGLPLVLYVHGGPWVRGAQWRWSAEAAYLASLGYAVLQPEFRGSTGWGRKLHESGYRQWGRAMQDDLDDGVDWLAKEGTIDPTRVCIMGASYGGYAVMMGLARDPERYRCGINYVGVTDIALMFSVTWSDFSDSDYIKYAAKEMIGDPDTDAAQLKATSPLEQAARIKAPVLMAYGGLDFRVPLVHGERMRDALLANGTPVEWIAYTEEGHGFMLESTRMDFYQRVARFLDRHIGAR